MIINNIVGSQSIACTTECATLIGKYVKAERALILYLRVRSTKNHGKIILIRYLVFGTES